MKKYLIGVALFTCVFLSLFPDTNMKELEDRLSRSTGNERIEILVELTNTYQNKDPKKVLKYGKEALELLETFPHQGHQVSLLNHISWANRNLGEYEEARKYGARAMEIAEKTENKTGYADALNNIGRAYKNLGNYSQAIDHSSRAQKIYEELGQQKGVANALDSIGTIYWKLSDYTRALDLLLKSCSIYETLGEKSGIAETYNNIGIIYWEVKDFDKSLEYYNKSWKIYEELGNQAGIAKILNNIAIIFNAQGKYSDALQFYGKSLKIKEDLGIQLGIANTLNNMGRVYEEKKDHQQALHYFRKSLKIKETINDRKGVASTIINISKIMRKFGRYKEALQYVNQGLAIATEINVKAEMKEAYEELSEIFEILRDYPKSLYYYKKYKEINDSIFNEINSKKMAEMQTRYDLEKKEKEISLLKKDREIHHLDLARQKNLKNSFIIISLLILIMVFVIYARYRLKIKVNRVLKKEMEDRKKAESELVKSRKLEAIGILVGGIAHDFNNLLAVTMGNLTMAIEDINNNDTSKAADMLTAAEKSSLQAAELVQKLITFSKGGWIIPQKLTLTTILESTMDHYPEMQPLLHSIHISPDLKAIYGDERHLREVIHNLLQNADEAMKDPKHVSIEAENIVLKAKNNFLLKQGEYVKLSITDNGRGIPQDHLEKIFDPYFSTKETVTQRGMGLGLAICYSVIKKHNGHIAVNSEPGKGTTVDLYLPVYSENQEEKRYRGRGVEG